MSFMRTAHIMPGSAGSLRLAALLHGLTPEDVATLRRCIPDSANVGSFYTVEYIAISHDCKALLRLSAAAAAPGGGSSPPQVLWRKFKPPPGGVDRAVSARLPRRQWRP